MVLGSELKTPSMLLMIRAGVNIDDCQLKSIKKAEPFLTLPNGYYLYEKNLCFIFLSKPPVLEDVLPNYL